MLIGTNTVGAIHEQLARDYMNGTGQRYRVDNMICYGGSIVVMFYRQYETKIGGHRVVTENRVAVFGADEKGGVRLKNDIIAN